MVLFVFEQTPNLTAPLGLFERLLFVIAKKPTLFSTMTCEN